MSKVKYRQSFIQLSEKVSAIISTNRADGRNESVEILNKYLQEAYKAGYRAGSQGTGKKWEKVVGRRFEFRYRCKL